MLFGLFHTGNEVDFVLQNNDFVQVHDLQSCYVLRGLWLGAGLVACYKQQSCVHDSSSVKHGGHQDVVAGAVDEADVPDQFSCRITLLTHSALGPVGAEGPEAVRFLARAPVNFGVGVAELDRNVPDPFQTVPLGPDASDGIDEG